MKRGFILGAIVATMLVTGANHLLNKPIQTMFVACFLAGLVCGVHLFTHWKHRVLDGLFVAMCIGTIASYTVFVAQGLAERIGYPEIKVWIMFLLGVIPTLILNHYFYKVEKRYMSLLFMLIITLVQLFSIMCAMDVAPESLAQSATFTIAGIVILLALLPFERSKIFVPYR